MASIVAVKPNVVVGNFAIDSPPEAIAYGKKSSY